MAQDAKGAAARTQISASSAVGLSGERDEDAICWICLESSTDLVYPCKCPRAVHAQCLARWQLQSAGTSRETTCDFCKCALPDWKSVLTPEKVAGPRSAPAVMNVNYGGRTYSFEVRPGPDGYAAFTRAIRRAFGLPGDSELNITFTCDEPTARDAGSLLTLQGAGAYDAAVHCASISAARRAASAEPPAEGSAARDAGAGDARAPHRGAPRARSAAASGPAAAAAAHGGGFGVMESLGGLAGLSGVGGMRHAPTPPPPQSSLSSLPSGRSLRSPSPAWAAQRSPSALPPSADPLGPGSPRPTPSSVARASPSLSGGNASEFASATSDAAGAGTEASFGDGVDDGDEAQSPGRRVEADEALEEAGQGLGRGAGAGADGAADRVGAENAAESSRRRRRSSFRSVDMLTAQSSQAEAQEDPAERAALAPARVRRERPGGFASPFGVLPSLAAAMGLGQGLAPALAFSRAASLPLETGSAGDGGAAGGGGAAAPGGAARPEPSPRRRPRRRTEGQEPFPLLGEDERAHLGDEETRSEEAAPAPAGALGDGPRAPGPAPTSEPASRALAPAAASESALRDLAPAAASEPASRALAPAAASESASRDLAPAAASEPASRALAPAAASESASRDLAPGLFSLSCPAPSGSSSTALSPTSALAPPASPPSAESVRPRLQPEGLEAALQPRDSWREADALLNTPTRSITLREAFPAPGAESEADDGDAARALAAGNPARPAATGPCGGAARAAPRALFSSDAGLFDVTMDSSRDGRDGTQAAGRDPSSSPLAGAPAAPPPRAPAQPLAPALSPFASPLLGADTSPSPGEPLRGPADARPAAGSPMPVDAAPPPPPCAFGAAVPQPRSQRPLRRRSTDGLAVSEERSRSHPLSPARSPTHSRVRGQPLLRLSSPSLPESASLAPSANMSGSLYGADEASPASSPGVGADAATPGSAGRSSPSPTTGGRLSVFRRRLRAAFAELVS